MHRISFKTISNLLLLISSTIQLSSSISIVALTYSVNESIRGPYSLANITKDFLKALEKKPTQTKYKFQTQDDGNPVLKWFSLSPEGNLSVNENIEIDREDTELCPVQNIPCSVKISTYAVNSGIFSVI